MPGYPHFSFYIPIGVAKICFPPPPTFDPKPCKNTSELGPTVHKGYGKEKVWTSVPTSSSPLLAKAIVLEILEWFRRCDFIFNFGFIN